MQYSEELNLITSEYRRISRTEKPSETVFVTSKKAALRGSCKFIWPIFIYSRKKKMSSNDYPCKAKDYNQWSFLHTKTLLAPTLLAFKLLGQDDWYSCIERMGMGWYELSPCLPMFIWSFNCLACFVLGRIHWPEFQYLSWATM